MARKSKKSSAANVLAKVATEAVKKVSQRRPSKPKKKKSSAGGAFAKGLGGVLKTLLPLLPLIPFSTSGSGVPLLGGGQTGGRGSAPFGGGSLAVTAPVANSFLSKTGTAKITQRRANSITVTHREYIRKVRLHSNNNWEIEFIQDINPGNAILFPYLSKLAPLYENFRFDELNFIYEPSTSTTTKGAVYMALDYDPADKNIEFKEQFLSMPGAVKTAAWYQMIFNSINPNLNRQKLYVQVGDRKPTGEDVRLNSAGRLYFATENETTTGENVGDLFVEYRCTLMVPQMDGNNCPSTILTSNSAPVEVGTNETQIFGNTTVTNYGTLGIKLTYGHTPGDAQLSQQLIFERVGFYSLLLKVAGTITGNVGGAGPVITPSKGSNIVMNPPIWNNTSGNFGFSADTFGATGASMAWRTLKVSIPGDKINIYFPNSWSAIDPGVRVLCVITQLDEDTFDDEPPLDPAPTVIPPSFLASYRKWPRKGKFLRQASEVGLKKFKDTDRKSAYSNEDSDSDLDEEPSGENHSASKESLTELEDKLYQAVRQLSAPSELDHLIDLLRGLRLKNFGTADKIPSRFMMQTPGEASFIPVNQ